MKPYATAVVFALLISGCATSSHAPVKAIEHHPRLATLRTVAIVADVTLLRDGFVEKFWSVNDSRVSAQHMLDKARALLSKKSIEVVSARAPIVGSFKDKSQLMKFAAGEGAKIEESHPPLYVDEDLIANDSYQQALTHVFANIIKTTNGENSPSPDAKAANIDVRGSLGIISNHVGGDAILFIVGNGVVVSGGKSLTQALVTGFATAILTLGLVTYSQWDVSTLDSFAYLIDSRSGEVLWTNSARFKGGNIFEGDFYKTWASRILNDILPAKDVNYVGCFKDAGNPFGTTGRDLSAYSERPKDMTVERCVSICGEKGYKYAGMQYSTHCFCDNSYGKNGPAFNCNMKCAGDTDQVCGGSWANSVYKTGIGKKD